MASGGASLRYVMSLEQLKLLMSSDEIIKAVHQNVLFRAKFIKIMVDSKPYPYTADDMRLFVREAANKGAEGRRSCPDGRRCTPGD